MSVWNDTPEIFTKTQYFIATVAVPATSVDTDTAQILVDTTVTAATLTLVPGLQLPNRKVILVHTSGTNGITVTPTGTTINGAASAVLPGDVFSDYNIFWDDTGNQFVIAGTNDNVTVIDQTVEGTLRVDTIDEYTTNAGVTIEAVLLKDGDATVGVLNYTSLNPAIVSGTGDVVGPAVATDQALVVYDGTTGNLVEDSELLLVNTRRSINFPTGTENVLLQAAGTDFLVEPNSTSVLLGQNAGPNATGVNTFIGGPGGGTLTSGARCVILGSSDVNGATNSDVVSIGNACVAATNGVAIGDTCDTGSGENCTLIGNTNGNSTSTGANCVMIGQGNGPSATSMNECVIIGNGCGINLTSGSEHILIGESAGGTIVTGNNCIILGKFSNALSDISNCVAIGNDARGGADCIAIGTSTRAGTGINSIAIGNSAGGPANIGTDSICIGSDAGDSATDMTDCVLIGHDAGTAITTADNCVFLGANSGGTCVSGGNNVCAGRNSDITTAGTTNAVAIGDGSVSAASGVAIGNGAYTGFGGNCIAIGLSTGNSVNTGNESVMIGTNAGNSATDSDFSVFVGSGAGVFITDGARNTFLGSATGPTCTIGDNNTILGADCDVIASTTSTAISIGNASTAATDCIAIGNTATTGTGVDCISIGAGVGNSANAGTATIIIGSSAGVALTNSTGAVLVGSGAGAALTTGGFSVLIGRSVAATLTTGGDNVIIGDDADVNALGDGSCVGIGSNSTVANQCTAVGDAASATHANSIALGRNATSAATNELVINGGMTSVTKVTPDSSVAMNVRLGATLYQVPLYLSANTFDHTPYHFTDEKTSGTDGGTFTLGAWRTRTLNTLRHTGSGTDVALSGTAGILFNTAGTYTVTGSAPTYLTGFNQTRVRKDGTSTLVMGTSARSDVSSNVVVRSKFSYTAIVVATEIHSFEHQCTVTQATNGLGRSVSLGGEVYTEVIVTRIS